MFCNMGGGGGQNCFLTAGSTVLTKKANESVLGQFSHVRFAHILGVVLPTFRKVKKICAFLSCMTCLNLTKP